MATTMAPVTPEGIGSRSRQAGQKRRHRLRWLLTIALVLVIVVAAAVGGSSWYFSSQLLAVAPYQPSYSLQVLALHGNRVTLTRTDETMRNQLNGLVWRGGRAVVGNVLSSNRTSVVRPISRSTGVLRVGTHVSFDNHIYASPAALHMGYRTVNVPDSLGPMPAWYVAGTRSTWVVLVHGYHTDRSEGLRPLPTLVHLGFPALLISYRNDVGAPVTSDHLYHLGATEWHDVEAGVRYALRHGARAVILYGVSMGGNAVEGFLHRSRFAPRIRAVVLDAPVLDWQAALDLAASDRHLPGFLAAVTGRVVAYRIGLSSLDAIDQVKAARDLTAPTLIFHGTADQRAPISSSVALASARPDLVTLVRFPGAAHVESYNSNPERYVTVLHRFLQQEVNRS